MYPIRLSTKFTTDIPRLKKENPKYLAKLWELILDIQRQPFEGVGQPEALKGNLQGWWSRRITSKHRLLYRIHNDHLELASCFSHYGDK